VTDDLLLRLSGEAMPEGLRNARRCGAMSKRTKQRCGAAAMRDKRVCYHHGGLAGPPKGNVNALRHAMRSASFVEGRKAFAALMRDCASALRQTD
jgi:hypothetical protein